MTARALAVQAAVCVLVMVGANAAVHVLTQNSVPRQVLRSIDRADAATHLFFGNSLMATAIDLNEFTRSHPERRPLNLALGASGPVEHLILLRVADKLPSTTVVYGFFDFQLTDPASAGWSELFGNRALGYYAEPELAARYYAAGNPLREVRLRATAWIPFLVERGGVWARVEVLRRRVGAVGMPARATTRLGRAEDFAALEAADTREFAARATSAVRDRVPLSPPVEELLRVAREQHPRLVVVEMPMTASHRARFYQASEWGAVRRYVRELVQGAGGEYVDASDWVPDDGFEDPLHLGKPGATQFTRRLAGELDGARDRR